MAARMVSIQSSLSIFAEESMRAALEQDLIEIVLKNPWNALILATAEQLRLDDWWLTAGCVAQSVWNAAYGREMHSGIRDYDLFYFDPDTSWAAEDDVIRRGRSLYAGLPIEVQIRNQARVPLWYEEKFGVPFGAVNGASDGIDRFPCATVAVGIRCLRGRFEVYAPFGLEPLFGGMLKPNRVLSVEPVYVAKTERWLHEWPHLKREPW